MTGPYAACGVDDETGENKECDNVFQGGYESIEYDPRYRPCYIDTKAAQKPIWSSPYPFFTLGMGVTYARPIYDTDPTNDGLQVFAGVIAVDYRCKYIG